MGFLNLVGQAVDRYDVGEQLGQGGFGAVFRARHRVVGNEVALKVLWPDHASDPKSVARFLQEARAAAAVGNEHIVRVFDAGTTPEGLVFLAMELLDGHDVEVELLERKRLPVDEAVELVRQVLDALVAAHARGIIHRDLKPANIMLAKDARGRRIAKLLDFGISKIAGSKSLTAKGAVLGTPHYMAPEQIEGNAVLDARADLYAVGTILYELITGFVPIEGDGYDVMVKRVQGSRPTDVRRAAPGISDGLADVIMRALAFDRDARFESASAMRRALDAAHAGSPLSLGSDAATLPANAVLAQGTPRSAPPASLSNASTPALSTAPTPGESVSASISQRIVPPKAAFPWIGIGVLAVMLAGGLGVLAVLGWRVLHLPEDDGNDELTVANPIPVPVVDLSRDRTIDEVAEPVVVPLPAAPSNVASTPAPAPAPDPNAMRMNIGSYVGRGARSEVQAVLDRARADAVRCATSRPLHLVVQVVFSGGGGVAISGHHPSRRSDDRDAADCVGAAIMRAGPAHFGGMQSAIVDLDVELPARR